jgi:hypothetical protein
MEANDFGRAEVTLLGTVTVGRGVVVEVRGTL